MRRLSVTLEAIAALCLSLTVALRLQEELLNRIAPALGICHRLVYPGLLCFPVFEEIYRHLREQGVGQHVFVLLAPLLHLFAQGVKLIRDQIRRTAGNDLCIRIQNLLLHFLIKRLHGSAVFAA